MALWVMFLGCVVGFVLLGCVVVSRYVLGGCGRDGGCFWVWIWDVRWAARRWAMALLLGIVVGLVVQGGVGLVFCVIG